MRLARTALLGTALLGTALGVAMPAQATAARWHFETLDGRTTGPDGRTTHALAREIAATQVAGLPHVFTRDDQTRALRHGAWDGRRWSFSVADGVSDVGPGLAALEYGAAPHAFYRDGVRGDLRHTWRTPSGWARETLDGAFADAAGRRDGDVGAYPAAILYGGVPHVFYNDSGRGDLRHAWWTGSAWRFETLDADGDVGAVPTAATDGLRLWVFHLDVERGDLRATTWDGRRWSSETLDGDRAEERGRVRGDVGYDPAAVLYGGSPHVFYAGRDPGLFPDYSLRHAWSTPTGWRYETLDGLSADTAGRITGNVGFCAEALLYGGEPHVWYHDFSGGDLRHAWWTGSSWRFETLDGAGGTERVSGRAGRPVAVVLYLGAPHAFYREEDSADLRHAWWG